MICSNQALKVASLLLAALVFSSCGKQATNLGQSGSVVSGSMRSACAQTASRELVKCGSAAVTSASVQNPNGYTVVLGYHLPSSPVPLVRLLAQQSACFRGVDRCTALRATVQEQALKNSGVLRQNGTVAIGNGDETQYTVTPALTVSEQNAGQQVGGVLAMIPVLNKLVGLAETVELKEAQVTLLRTDNETTEQLAASTGSVKITDLGMDGLALGKPAGAGWSNSNKGKVIAVAFLDVHKHLVTQVRQLQAKEMPAPVATKGSSKG